MNACHKRLLTPLACGLISLLLAHPAAAKLFVPKLEPWPLWTASSEDNRSTIDHAEWQLLLDTYLITDAADGINRFDYRSVTETDRRGLKNYIGSLTALDPRDYARAEQFPYWVNLYNALTVALVLKHYPVNSIRRVEGGILSTGPWKKPLIEVAGQPLSLNDIEHRILRPIWRDPRIHYAVNCASLGCPNLAPQAYTAANTESLLDQSESAYINHPRGVSFEQGTLTLSSIYDWYDSDFGADRAALLAYLRHHAEPELAASLSTYRGKIRYRYDWDLNEP